MMAQLLRADREKDFRKHARDEGTDAFIHVARREGFA